MAEPTHTTPGTPVDTAASAPMTTTKATEPKDELVIAGGQPKPHHVPTVEEEARFYRAIIRD